MHPALKTLLRAHVADAPLYVSAAMAADKDDDLVFLNANENPYELPGLAGLNSTRSRSHPSSCARWRNSTGVGTGACDGGTRG